MSVFIKLDPSEWFQEETGIHVRENGYYETSSSSTSSYKQISDKFKIRVTFNQSLSRSSYTIMFMIKISNFWINFSFYTEYVICEMFDGNIGFKNILYQCSDSKINLNEINSIVDQYQTIQSNLPSLRDIMSFLDLIPDEHSENVRIIKDLFMDGNENERICDWKSGLKLLIDYRIEQLILPTIII